MDMIRNAATRRAQSTPFQRVFLPFVFLCSGMLTIGAIANGSKGLSDESAWWVSAWQYVILAVCTGGLLFAIFRRKTSRVWVEGVLAATICFGVWYIATLSGTPLWMALAVSSLLILSYVMIGLAVLHDLVYLIGSAGVAIVFAVWLPPEVLVVGLATVTVYDVVAGTPNGPAADLAAAWSRLGIVPGFILPVRARDLLSAARDAAGSSTAYIGASDMILPLMLVARSAFRSVTDAALVLGGVLIGALVLSYRNDLHPRAALLPLALGAAVPFSILTFVSRV